MACSLYLSLDAAPSNPGGSPLFHHEEKQKPFSEAFGDLDSWSVVHE